MINNILTQEQIFDLSPLMVSNRSNDYFSNHFKEFYDVTCSYIFEKIFKKTPNHYIEFTQLSFNQIKPILTETTQNNKNFQILNITQKFFENETLEVITYIDVAEKIIIRLDSGYIKKNRESSSTIIITSEKPPTQELLNKIDKSKAKQSKNSIGVILSGNGLYVQENEIFIPAINIEKNYGKDFAEKNQQIINKLNKKSNGLIILHGISGTGKTHYIKHLISQVNRKFLFYPTAEIHSITTPNILSILNGYEDSVIIFEDAEKAIISRENVNGNASLVSSLLNLSDGLLGSIFNITLIVTFNTTKENIDEALLRKGRLLARHEFCELSKEDAIYLAKFIGKDENKITKPLTLADIYNIDDDNYNTKEEKPKLGFMPS